MTTIKLHNTRTRTKEDFVPIDPEQMCGCMSVGPPFMTAPIWETRDPSLCSTCSIGCCDTYLWRGARDLCAQFHRRG